MENTLNLQIKGTRISPRETVIVRRNGDVIEFGTRRPNNFRRNETFGTVPNSDETYKKILMTMPQIIDIIETNISKGEVFVKFDNDTLIKYDAKTLPELKEIEKMQALYDEERLLGIELGRKAGQSAMVKKFAKAVISTTFGTLALATLSGCNLTITGSNSRSAENSYSISIGNDAPAKNDPEPTPITIQQATPQATSEPTPITIQQATPQATPEPTPTAVVNETEMQAKCREAGKAMWNDILARNPKMMVVDGFNAFHEVNITGSEQITMDYFALIAGIKSVYMESMTEAEIDSYTQSIFNYGNMVTAQLANPNNTDAQKVNPCDYMDASALTTIANNTFAVMQNAINLRYNDPRRYDVDKTVPSEEAKFTGYRAEDEILMAYANATIGNDILFDKSTDGFKAIVLNSISFGLSSVPMYTFIVDEQGIPLYHTYFERNSSDFMVWQPRLENGETIFYQNVCGQPIIPVGTYYRMKEIQKDWNDDNNNIDIIQEMGIAKRIEDQLLALQSDVITRPSSQIGQIK